MNETFREYTTSTAFALQLSKLQCHAILRCRDRRTNDARMPLNVATYSQLEARGLVFWRYKDGRAYEFGGLTPEGRLVAMLLKRAGLTIENTVTLSVARMNARAA